MRDVASQIKDKNGRIIRKGDIVKVYHFTGARRKRYYMYKQCLGVTRVFKDGSMAWSFDHLDLGHTRPYEVLGGEILTDYEIIQSCDGDHEVRDAL